MFTKLFSSITDSTIWREPDHVRLVWITMLAKCDKHGIVYASVPGLADAARVDLEHCQDALFRLSSPDKWSRTKEEEGRRILEVDGGWMLINHAKYKRIKDADERREYIRQKVQEHRDSKHSVNNVNNVNTGKPGKHIRSDQIRSDKEDIYSSEFIEFWNAYPKKIGKGGAWNSFRKLKANGDLVGKMVSALAAQKETDQWRNDNGKYIPNPQTWLNQRRWEDEGVIIKKQSLKDDPFWKQ